MTTRKNGRYAIDRQDVDMQPPARKSSIDKGFRAAEDPDTHVDDSVWVIETASQYID